MKKAWTCSILMGSTLIAYIVYAFLQPSYTYQFLDPRFDAHQYAKIYTYFKRFTVNYEITFPFNTRILMPWLAAHLPFNDLRSNFIWLNGFFIVMTVGLLVWIWLKLNIRSFWIAIALFWVVFHWKGLVRMYLPDPVTADVGGYFLLTSFSALLLFEEKRISKALLDCLFVLIAVLGTLQKESFIAVVGVTVTWTALNLINAKADDYARYTVNRAKGYFQLFFLSLIIYYLTAFFFPSASLDWRNNSFVSILRGMKRYVEQPNLLLRLPVSWLMAFGTFWLALIPSLKLSNKPASHFSLLIPHFYLWLFLSVFGGGDTTRILFNGMPFILTYLLLKLNQQPKWTGWYILITALPLMRLNTLEPDLGRYPNEMHQWCVECWTLAESWRYWVYALTVLVGYYYLSRRFGAVGSDEAHEINAGR
ncbi:hypothetical protein [Runella sp.]|uniref:hypothetical protein n=1 Tax=Runella sp. TaxID=1960881 RepID=UPI003D0E2578